MKYKHSFVVSVELPYKVPNSHVREYVKDAVASWRGQLRPPGASDDELDYGDPMWYVDPESVRVRYVGKPKRAK